jgi:LPS export ABC transporter protein LptC
MAATYKKPRTLKIILLVTIIVAIGSVIAIYVDFRSEPAVEEPVAQSTEPDATLSINKIQQTATRDGEKEWSLEASSGHYIDKTQELKLKNVRVTFFLKDKSEIILNADQGILKTDSNDIEVFGSVVLTNKDYTLLSEKLNYVHSQRKLYSKTPVTISGATTRLTAGSLLFDIDTRRLTLEGDVATVINEDFTL